MCNKPGMSLDEIRAFLKASEAVHFAGEKKEVYAWVSGCLGEQKWDDLGRTARGLVRRYMEKMTGLSRAQITRLISRYGEDGEVRVKHSRRHRFRSVYRRDDVALLGSVDEAHETLSGPATQKILQRQFYSATSAISGWRESRWPKSIDCAKVRRTGRSGWSIKARAPCR